MNDDGLQMEKMKRPEDDVCEGVNDLRLVKEVSEGKRKDMARENGDVARVARHRCREIERQVRAENELGV